jgi:hypothetical protein
MNFRRAGLPCDRKETQANVDSGVCCKYGTMAWVPHESGETNTMLIHHRGELRREKKTRKAKKIAEERGDLPLLFFPFFPLHSSFNG